MASVENIAFFACQAHSSVATTADGSPPRRTIL